MRRQPFGSKSVKAVDCIAEGPCIANMLPGKSRQTRCSKILAKFSTCAGHALDMWEPCGEFRIVECIEKFGAFEDLGSGVGGTHCKEV